MFNVAGDEMELSSIVTVIHHFKYIQDDDMVFCHVFCEVIHVVFIVLSLQALFSCSTSCKNL